VDFVESIVNAKTLPMPGTERTRWKASASWPLAANRQFGVGDAIVVLGHERQIDVHARADDRIGEGL
jgi:hypothetical protein